MAAYRENHCILCPKAFCCPTCRHNHEKIVHKIDLSSCFYSCYMEQCYNPNEIIERSNRILLSTPGILGDIGERKMNTDELSNTKENQMTPYNSWNKTKDQDTDSAKVQNEKYDTTEAENKRYKKTPKNVTFCTSTPNCDFTRRTEQTESLVQTHYLTTTEEMDETETSDSSAEDELFKTTQFDRAENFEPNTLENVEEVEISLTSTSNLPQGVWQTIASSIKSALETTKNYCKFADISTKRVLDIADDDDDQNPSPKRRKYESIKCRPPIHELPILRLKFHKWTQTEDRYFQ